ncbi:MAG: TlpA disulfide reductase family protein [Bryobacteraceae bacterium]
MTFRTILIVALLALTPAVEAQPTASAGGLWDASVTVNDLRIPFRLEIVGDRSAVVGSFFNGEERVSSTSGSFVGGELRLGFAHYATTLSAKLVDGQLEGKYDRGSKGSYAFHAKHFVPSTFGVDEVPSIAGYWEIPVHSPKGESAWRFLVRQSGGEASATILRVDGDTGLLSGKFAGGKFLLSHFSGARPSLLEVTPLKDGTLEIVQNGKTKYTAIRAEEARAKGLPEPSDPSRHTSVKDPSEPFRFSFPDLTGKIVSESDAQFRGKVVLINITGSWCPNCHDEAPFLAELFRTYRDQGLEIVALSFEEAEQLADPTRLRAFIARYGIGYTVLLGGEQEDLKTKLPQAVNLNSWPTTFFVGRDGLVRGAHAGFAGPASGEVHQQAKREFVTTIEKLLAENQSSRR